MMSDLYFNEESDYSEENTSEYKNFVSAFFNHFNLNLNRKKHVIMRAIRKELQKQSFADILQNICS